MSALDRIAFGAPGVFSVPPEPIRRLTGERMDVAAFVGVAPRGPCRVPWVDHSAALADDWRMCDPDRRRQRSVAVAVESFDEYRLQFGGAAGPFAGPGLLPYAVAAFFEQGGRRAYVVRIVHAYGEEAKDAAGVASGVLAGVAGTVRLHARNEGSWGNGLRAEIRWVARPLQATPQSTSILRLAAGHRLDAGALLRLRLVDGTLALRFVASVGWQNDAKTPQRWRLATLETPTSDAITAVEVVEGMLSVADGTGAVERFASLGLHVDHPRWMATVLCRDSRMAWPDFAWAGDRVMPADATLTPSAAAVPQFTGGADRYQDLVHDDFFDAGWVSLADSENDQVRFSGVQTLTTLSDLTQIVVPDLYHPQPLKPPQPIADLSLAGPDFAPCVTVDAPAPPSPPQLPALALDPQDASQLAKITALQHRLAAFVETTRSHILLLDVPPRLTVRQMLAWRSVFDSAYVAAYHPWLGVVRDDDRRNTLVLVPPSAAAAGIIAARELSRGIAAGPANEIARATVLVERRVPPVDHDVLHPAGINVYLQERDGVRLSAARTLALDPLWRQLSVRRLMLMLRRALAKQMQWVVFEANTPALRRELVRMIDTYLRGLFRLGAFRGAVEEEAFFVCADDTLNTPYRIDNGQLVVEVGVAPAEPLEFIVVRIVRDGDGTLTLED
jgi:hypothetical protein